MIDKPLLPWDYLSDEMVRVPKSSHDARTTLLQRLFSVAVSLQRLYNVVLTSCEDSVAGVQQSVNYSRDNPG